MKVLVTGGAGYIGSFMVRKLRDEGHEVVILDNLSGGHAEAVSDFRLEQIDLVTQKFELRDLLEKEKFDGVVHMASFIQMGESFRLPAKYYENNVLGFLNLVDMMIVTKTNNLIISSSAGVYGNPVKLPIQEDDPKNPLNPYGETKYIIERIADDYKDAYGLNYISIRYFNAAGAALDGSVGEAHPEESHLIPNLILKAMRGEEIEVFGDDYDTPDGTCIRDYIHVLDLADNHLVAVQKLVNEGRSGVYNAGIGRGYSNKEVIEMVKKVTGLELKIKFGPRRPGDANALYASNEKIKQDLNWEPKYGLKEIVESAYLWHKNSPNGYQDLK